MKLTFLGTGTSSGVPMVGCDCFVCESSDPQDHRLRTSCFIEIDETKILIDLSPDFRQQCLRYEINDIDFVLLTHEHNDHIAGIDDIRGINFRHQKSTPLYAQKRVCEALKERYQYIFSASYATRPRVNLMEVRPGEIINHGFQEDKIHVTPIAVDHGGLPILGYRINNLAYLTDIKRLPEESFALIEGIDYLVITALRPNVHPTHMNIEEAIALSKRIGPKRTYFIHMSHRFGLHQSIQQSLPENITIAYDGLVMEV